jgi:hypothetical protein
LSAEQINPQSMTAVAQDKLRHFNRVLEEQADSLQDELSSAQAMARMEFDLDNYGRITPKVMQTTLRELVQGIGGLVKQMQADLRIIQDDTALKRWVKQQQAMMHGMGDFY